MSDAEREARVLDAVVTMVDALLSDFDVIELLTDLTGKCVGLLDISSAGLLLADPRGQLHLMTATSDRTEEIELLQLQADEGPCLDCSRSGEPVSVADLADAAERWPRFVPAARAAGFASVHAVPMKAAGRTLGALGLFSTQVGVLNGADLLVGRSLAHVASVAIMQENAPTADAVLPRLRSALANQIAVDQAKGLIRQQLDVTIADAFALLRHYATVTGTHLSQVARQLMSEPGSRPATIAALREFMTSAQTTDAVSQVE